MKGSHGRDHTLVSRGTLAMTSVEAFAAWAEAQGWRREPIPPKAEYEALRLRPKRGGAPIIFWRREHRNCRGGAPKHLSASRDGERLVRQWIRTKGKTGT